MADARSVLMTAEEAGPMLGVDPETIKTWFKRGKIASHGVRHKPGPGRPARLFAWGELMDAEESTRPPGSPGFLTNAV